MWQYAVTIVAALFIALIAVWFDHWLSGRNEYRKAIDTVKDELSDNILICDGNCQLIDSELNFSKENGMGLLPYFYLADLAWTTWKSVIMLRNSELAGKIGAAYIDIPTVNRLLDRMEELKWGSIAELPGAKQLRELNRNMAKNHISTILLPRLKAARELTEKESQKESHGWLRKRF